MTHDEIMAEARSIPDFIPFIALFGAAVSSGRSADILAVLTTTAGFDAALVWALIETWCASEADEMRTGWSAESTTVASLLHSDRTRCHATDWTDAIHRLAFSG